eukprot:11352673-Prorocentrum_lima.AAC.1
MTSSLVGSEMCIRDRHSSPILSTTMGEGGAFIPSGPRSTKEVPQCASPVSYTHLTLPTICSV